MVGVGLCSFFSRIASGLGVLRIGTSDVYSALLYKRVKREGVGREGTFLLGRYP